MQPTTLNRFCGVLIGAALGEPAGLVKGVQHWLTGEPPQPDIFLGDLLPVLLLHHGDPQELATVWPTLAQRWALTDADLRAWQTYGAFLECALTGQMHKAAGRPALGDSPLALVSRTPHQPHLVLALAARISQTYVSQVGALLGAVHGLEGLPIHLQQSLDERDGLLSLARRLYGQWSGQRTDLGVPSVVTAAGRLRGLRR
ncbi:MAG: hypothetical protein IGQ88_05155 [Gloeomargaritaceae cyanobacterium C42_A2020_066]|nr:hypothetical protein [Gloeomargaritaceae cyanobacterium C42_A2020_066]